MKFPNAVKGVRKLFVAELIEVISLILFFVASVLVALPGGSDPNSALATASATITIVVGIAGLIAFIIQLVGLFQGKKDEANFGYALWVILVSILLAVAGIGLGFIQQGWATNVVNYLDVAQRILSVLLLCFILTGISVLADKVGQKDYAARGRILRFIFSILLLVGGTIRLLTSIFRTNAIAVDVIGYIGIAGAAIELIASIWYLIYLGKAAGKLSK